MKRLGIVVPFRNRWEHYYVFLYCIQKYLNKKDIDYKIIVVEQDDGGAFNRGMLCNIGFLQAEKLKCDYVVFHDIDMIPEDVDYSYSDKPIHLATTDIPFESYFGGVTLFPTDIFKKINGFSNKYWGWGFEDDDLRYRCIQNNIQFNSSIKSTTVLSRTLKFNGYNSFVEIQNFIQPVKGFKIELVARLDYLVYDDNKEYDKFVLLDIKDKYNFTLYFSSFKRFTLEFFDTRGKLYQVHSKVVSTSNFEIVVEYLPESKEVVFSLNAKEVERVQLRYALYNYKSAKTITIGADSELKNNYKGSIDTLNIADQNKYICKFESDKLEGYEWKDLSDNKCNGKLVNVAHGLFSTPINYDSFIPFRRDSIMDMLTHTNNGYNGNRWKDDLTRWNQLRYNNNVSVGETDNTADGLSSCEYITHSKKRVEKVTHLVVGIN